ncbi:fluoroquinolone transport system ATP-binding protein [Caldalkalibacillus uzonensis]|uniref:Fluoroquinolone transport system ATP-binding protein n=1 Tax=Caldalkalibacillus uzonensis TaxID=353224 RepID=A0ABU0CNN1_9BACI|nr:ABC transporter ATP-binding protein [Caldalkalibacillus uzonensis]MDQ0338023.1 fluoroquinolone transport system ATP-binding protein [Caldalkalibacillus uzonensis]
MIEVNRLAYRYPGNTDYTIKGIDFEVNKGEIFGFLGPSGAGKSTILKILIGILKNYEGKVKVAGQEVKQTGADFFEQIGVAFEFPNFYTRFTALENLTFFGSLYSVEKEDPLALLARVGLRDVSHTKVAHFSKGMKMRLNLCRALLHKPQLIFLDEPTSGLDPQNKKMVRDLVLDKKYQGKTIIISTHDMNFAEQICDRVAFIVEGKISLIDSPRRLKIERGHKVLRVEYRANGTTQQADFKLRHIGSNQKFLKLIKEKEIETMHTQETTLEEIFIDVTGRSLS